MYDRCEFVDRGEFVDKRRLQLLAAASHCARRERCYMSPPYNPSMTHEGHDSQESMGDCYWHTLWALLATLQTKAFVLEDKLPSLYKNYPYTVLGFTPLLDLLQCLLVYSAFEALSYSSYINTVPVLYMAPSEATLVESPHEYSI